MSVAFVTEPPHRSPLCHLAVTKSEIKIKAFNSKCLRYKSMLNVILI